MVIIKGKIEQEKEQPAYIHPTDEDYTGYTMEDYMKADTGLTKIQKIIILVVTSNDWVKSNNEEFSAQLTKFSNSLNGISGPTDLATKYGYKTDQLLAIKNDAENYAYFILKHGAGASYSKSWTSTGDEFRSGKGLVAPTWPMGDPLTDPVPPTTSVLPGIEPRFRVNASFAKDQTIYLTADGITMGIEASSTPFVPADGKPDLEGTVGNGGHPFFRYTKSKYQGINIYKNSNDGKGFVFSHTVNDPTYTDYAPLPAVGVSAVWIYRAFYLYKGKEVGTISADVTLTVIGITAPTV